MIQRNKDYQLIDDWHDPCNRKNYVIYGKLIANLTKISVIKCSCSSKF